MVKILMSSITTAIVAADDETVLLQMFAGVRQSQGQRILAAVAEEANDTICLPAVAGDVAPVAGSFTAMTSQQVVVVAAGSMAGEAGTFCVAKQDVLLIQRTFGLNTAGDFEVALGTKNNQVTTTTTTTDWRTEDDRQVSSVRTRSTVDKEPAIMTAEVWATFDFKGDLSKWVGIDFKGDLNKEVSVKAGECPSMGAGLVQTVEASVSDKQQQQPLPARQEFERQRLFAAQMRICECRAFLKSAVDTPNFMDELAKLQTTLATAAVQGPVKDSALTEVLLQRNFDAALATKNEKTTTTTTTTIRMTSDTSEFAPLVRACDAASDAMSWTEVASQLNNPAFAELFQSFNITGGWQHCDKSWVVEGACRSAPGARLTSID